VSLTSVVVHTFSSRSEDSTGGLSSSLPPATAPSQYGIKLSNRNMLLTFLSTGKVRLSVCLPFNIILHINVVNKTEGFLQAWGSKLMLSYLPIPVLCQFSFYLFLFDYPYLYLYVFYTSTFTCSIRGGQANFFFSPISKYANSWAISVIAHPQIS
jgi:hypothetical protein